MEPTLEGDAALTGTLEYTRSSEYLSDEPPHVASTEEMAATLEINMNRDAYDDDAFVDAGSTYEVDRSTHYERQFGDCMAMYDTRSLGTFDFKDHLIGPESENNLTGFFDPGSSTVVLAVVIHYPFTVTADECNPTTVPASGVSDVLVCSPNFGLGLEGAVTEIPAAPDRVEFECSTEGDAMDYDTQTVTVAGTLLLR